MESYEAELISSIARKASFKVVGSQIYFDLLPEAFVFSGSQINWDRVRNSTEMKPIDKYSTISRQKFFSKTAMENGLKGFLYDRQDGHVDIAITMTIRDLEQVLGDLRSLVRFTRRFFLGAFVLRWEEEQILDFRR